MRTQDSIRSFSTVMLFHNHIFIFIPYDVVFPYTTFSVERHEFPKPSLNTHGKYLHVHSFVHLKPWFCLQRNNYTCQKSDCSIPSVHRNIDFSASIFQTLEYLNCSPSNYLSSLPGMYILEQVVK